MKATQARARLAQLLPEWTHYALALAVVALEYWVRWSLDRYLVTTSYLPFFPGVLLVARLFGRGPAILATITSAVVATYYFVPPYGALDLTDVAQAMPFGLFVAVGLFMIEIVERLNSANTRLIAEMAATERARADLAEVSAQRELLLDEINHRIKNHLQSVAGLASVAARGSASHDEARHAIEALEARLQILARVYDRLRLTAAEATLDARPFIEAMCSDLDNSIIGSRPVTIIGSAEAIKLSADQAVLVGLVVNELVQNALKHAFPDDRAGTVEVRFTRSGTTALLTVADDGVGAAAGAKGAGSGSRLIQSLARQLGGEITRTNAGGTKVAVSFPLSPQAVAAAPSAQTSSGDTRRGQRDAVS